MTPNQHPHYLSFDKLPLFIHMVDAIFHDTEKMLPLFRQAKEKPWVLDDALVARSIRLYTERLAIIADYQEQIERWRTKTLTTRQIQALDKLTTQLHQTKQTVTELLELAEEIKQHTIDQILARDDVTVAFDVLSGKLKLPKA